MNDNTNIHFTPDKAFKSVFSYNLFVTEAKKADAFEDRSGKLYVHQDWLVDFAKEIEVSDKNELVRYTPRPKVYMPSTFVDAMPLIPDSLKSIPFEYNRAGMFSPVMNDISSPDELNYYTYSNQVESNDLFLQHNVGNTTVFAIPSDLSSLPGSASFIKDNINGSGLKFVNPDNPRMLMAIYIYPNIVIFTHKFNSQITRVSPEVSELYKKMFLWLEKVHITDKAETKKYAKDANLRIARNIFKAHIDTTTTVLTKEVRDLEQAVENNKMRLFNDYQNLENKRRLIESFDADKSVLVDKIVDDVLSAKDLDSVKDIKFEKDHIKVITNQLIMIPPSDIRQILGDVATQIEADKKHGKVTDNRLAGPFEITIKYNSSNIVIKPIGKAPKIAAYWSGPGSGHPHINSEGNACWGNASSTIAELHAKQEFSMLIMFLMNYLKTFNPGDPAGRQFYRWPVATTEVDTTVETITRVNQ